MPRLGTVRVRQDPHDAANTSLGEGLLMPLKQVSTGTLRRNLESAIDILHKHIDQVVLVHSVNGLVDLRRLNREQHSQSYVKGVVLKEYD